MSTGFDSAAVAPGTHFSQWDVASRRRYNASQGAPRPSWDVPSMPHPASDAMTQAVGNVAQQAAAPTFSSALQGPEANAMAAYRGSALQDAAAQTAGARLTAQNSAHGDPSMAAYGSLEGELGGQSKASHDVNAYNAQLLNQQQQQEFQKQMMAYQYQLAEQQMKDANQNAWLGDLGGIAGTVLGSTLGPIGAGIGGRIGGALGGGGNQAQQQYAPWSDALSLARSY
jgi:hypothetical protein